MYSVDKYVVELSHDGDPTEKAGIRRYELGHKFPNYAKFWWQFVVPNRDENDKSKLRQGFSEKIEEIFNMHYSVFYQLTYACGQIKFLSNADDTDQEPPNCFVEMASPFYHLASVIDLIEQIFVVTIRLNRPDLIEQISREKYNKKTAKRWETYAGSFQADGSIESLVCVVQTVKDLFLKAVPKSQERSEFEEVQEDIRHYRNKFIHGVSPLRLVENEAIYFPNEKNILQYANGHWSATRNDTNREHYEPAIEIMTRLTDKLVNSANRLWNILIDEMQKYASVPSNEIRTQGEPPDERIYRNTFYQPPTKPSGINFNAMGSAIYQPDNRPPEDE